LFWKLAQASQIWQLVVAMPSLARSKALPREEWDFRSRFPAPAGFNGSHFEFLPEEEVSPCYWYEKDRMDKRYVSEIEAWRRTAARSDFSGYVKHYIHCRRAGKEHPFDFFAFWPEWPQTPYLAILKAVRRDRWRRWTSRDFEKPPPLEVVSIQEIYAVHRAAQSSSRACQSMKTN
jgi:hypothetical protein